MTRQDEVLRLFGAKPLLIEAAKLDAAYGSRKPYAFQDGVAIIDVAGLLANEPSLFEAIFFGATAYSQVLNEVEQAVSDPDVRGILLRVNSPGGDSDNAFETAAGIRELARQKPIWAVADNVMFSAAYLLGSAAERIYVPEFTGGAGSIGVYVEHIDWSEYNRALGVKVTYISEGDGKTDGNPNEPLSDSARTKLEAEVARMYGLFVSAVADRRGLSQTYVRKLGAALIFGPDAVTAGLADRVGGFRTALADLASFVNRNGKSASLSTATQQGGKHMNEDLAPPEPKIDPKIDLEAIRTEARQQGYAEAREIVELCVLAGMPAKAAGLLARTVSAAEARQFLMEARVAEDAAEIHSHVLPDTGTKTTPSLDNNPVIKAAERLAAKGVN